MPVDGPAGCLPDNSAQQARLQSVLLDDRSYEIASDDYFWRPSSLRSCPVTSQAVSQAVKRETSSTSSHNREAFCSFTLFAQQCSHHKAKAMNKSLLALLVLLSLVAASASKPFTSGPGKKVLPYLPVCLSIDHMPQTGSTTTAVCRPHRPQASGRRRQRR